MSQVNALGNGKHPPHRIPPRFTHREGDKLPGGRPLAEDAYVRDYRRLDALSRGRALTLAESLRLEECIRRLDRRAGWRASKREHGRKIYPPEFQKGQCFQDVAPIAPNGEPGA